MTGESSNTSDSGFGLETESPRVVWRKRVQQRLDTIRILDSETSALESEIVTLWELFYACDVPDEREEGIRPRLKQRIGRQLELSIELTAAKVDLQEILADARRNGALPGWFRDLVK